MSFKRKLTQCRIIYFLTVEVEVNWNNLLYRRRCNLKFNQRRNHTAMFSLTGRKTIYWNTHQITLKRKPNSDKKISMFTLSEEFKPVALGNCEFEDQQNMNVNWTLLPFRTIKTPIRVTQSEIVLPKTYLEK